MSEMKTFLALFTDIDPAVDAIDHLREHGVKDDQMNVISGIPLTDHILGRPRVWSNVPRLALGGAMAGLLFGLFLSLLAIAFFVIQYIMSLNGWFLALRRSRGS